MKGGYFTSTFWILISCISGHAKKSTCCYIKALLALVLWYWSFRCCISKCRIKGIDHRVHERGMIGLTCLMMPSKTGFILCWLCTFLSLFLCGIEESSVRDRRVKFRESFIVTGTSCSRGRNFAKSFQRLIRRIRKNFKSYTGQHLRCVSLLCDSKCRGLQT